jgi:hypothetical protein
MSSGDGGISLGAGAGGNIGGANPSGFTMPDGSGSTLFTLPNGNVALPGEVQNNPLSMGQGVMNSQMMSGAGMGGLRAPQSLGMGGAGGGSGTQAPLMGMHSGGMGGGHGGAMSFMPSSAITLPYSLATGGTQSLLQQIMQRANSNPSAMG